MGDSVLDLAVSSAHTLEMKGIALGLGILLAFVSGIGCKGKPTLVGRWTGTIQAPGMSVEAELAFDKSGTLAFKQTAMGQSSTQMGPYKEAEKSVEFTPTTIESPTLTKAQADQLNAQLAAANKTVTFDLVWKDADHITITQRGAPAPLDKALEFTRVKG